MRKLTLGILREGKQPPDRRVPFTPAQCRSVMEGWPIEIIVEPSQQRCFPDEAYVAAGIRVEADLAQADVLMGVKEVPIDALLRDKSYFFFSHTIKKQPYNRELLRAVLQKQIRLIDYEVLTDTTGARVVAFGFYAGVVGAHNTLYAYGCRTATFSLPRMHTLLDYEEARMHYRNLQLPPCRVVVTGKGRVSQGAVQVLRDMGMVAISPEAFLETSMLTGPVFTVLGPEEYATRIDGGPFDRDEFYTHPQRYRSQFQPYMHTADIFINAILWKKGAPAFFTREDMAATEFAIQVIGDISCDIAPEGSIPSTLRASTIQDPVFGYDPHTGGQTLPYLPDSIDMMTIDNLPSELPRDASTDFGIQLLQHVVPALVQPQSDLLDRATIAREGRLTAAYSYLDDYVRGT
jgi:saccharopine dehydrogenase (NAD+, L-lysine-forming)